MIKELPETIISAAIWYKNPELKNTEILEQRGFRPYNVDCGVVVSGWRHLNCMSVMTAIYGLPNHRLGESVDGFLTNKNRFVDREEGAILHVKNGGKLNYSKTLLYSEDLY